MIRSRRYLAAIPVCRPKTFNSSHRNQIIFQNSSKQSLSRECLKEYKYGKKILVNHCRYFSILNSNIARRPKIPLVSTIFHKRGAAVNVFNQNKSIPLSLLERHFSTNEKGCGLFTLNFHNPADFLSSSQEAINTCNSLRSTLATTLSQTLTPSLASETLYLLDGISNSVCGVIDAAELCRSVHNDPSWRESAAHAFHILSEYIADLNGDVTLHATLLRITSDANVMHCLTEEERRMAILLQAEYERNGIHLPDEEREHVKRLNGHVVRLESMFIENLTKVSGEYVNVSKQQVEDVIPGHVIKQYVPQQNTSTETITISSDTQITSTLLKYSPSASLRQEVYMHANTACSENIEVLDALIKRRHELATAMNFPSYAHRFTSDKMANTPNNVMTFLDDVSQRSWNPYVAETNLLQRVRQAVEKTYNTDPIQPWDMKYYSTIAKQNLFAGGEGDSSDTDGYFTVEQCVKGMQLLVERLFGISMTEEPFQPGEGWVHSSTYNHIDDHHKTNNTNDSTSTMIRKFNFWNENDEHNMGIMYLDLYPRQGKYTHAAHFTVRGGCAIRDSTYFQKPNPNSNRQNGLEYQSPIVALVCNLSSPSTENSILSHSEVETLFHEFGHALHSLLSRTAFQHLSGTRAAMDFIETPSHLMEQYAWHPEFLKIIGIHYSTGDTLPTPAIDRLLNTRNAFRATEIRNQILLANFDQVIFGIPDLSSGKSTSDIYAELHVKHSIPFAEGTHFYSRFGHLVTYGAGYYSYLYASIFSADLWKKTFGGGSHAFSRDAGMKVWKKMLVHGGAKDPNLMLEAVLGRKPEVQPFFSSIE